jgi:transposase-like protein
VNVEEDGCRILAWHPAVADYRMRGHGAKSADKPIGRFVCSCGYVFSLAAAPGSKPRILDLGPLFRQRLRQLASEGIGLRATARALCVDPGTVRRHAERLTDPKLDADDLSSPAYRGFLADRIRGNRDRHKLRWGCGLPHLAPPAVKLVRMDTVAPKLLRRQGGRTPDEMLSVWTERLISRLAAA